MAEEAPDGLEPWRHETIDDETVDNAEHAFAEWGKKQGWLRWATSADFAAVPEPDKSLG